MSQDSTDIGSFAIISIISIFIGFLIGGFVEGRVGSNIGTVASAITIIGGVIAGHRYLKEYDINIVRSILGESPDGDYGILFLPSMSGLVSDRELAFKILDSDEWHFDGHGNHPNMSRKILSYLFESRRFSNRRMELSILIITTLSFALFLVILTDILGESSVYGGLYGYIAQLYPDYLSIRQTIIPLFLSIAGSWIGFAYLYSKSVTTCPEGVPFSLKSEGRYYRREDLQRETRRDDEGNSYEVTIAYGKHVFYCVKHDVYLMKDITWARN